MQHIEWTTEIKMRQSRNLLIKALKLFRNTRQQTHVTVSNNTNTNSQAYRTQSEKRTTCYKHPMYGLLHITTTPCRNRNTICYTTRKIEEPYFTRTSRKASEQIYQIRIQDSYRHAWQYTQNNAPNRHLSLSPYPPTITYRSNRTESHANTCRHIPSPVKALHNDERRKEVHTCPLNTIHDYNDLMRNGAQQSREIDDEDPLQIWE